MIRKTFFLVALTSLSWAAVPSSDAVEGIRAFSFDVYHRLNQTERNFVVSPFNLSTCLSMAYLGAEGETAVQMREALHYPEGEPASLLETFRLLSASLAQSGVDAPYQLSFSDSIWLDNRIQPLESYREAVTQGCFEGLKESDFSNSNEVIQAVNADVAEKTGGRIQELLQEGDIDASTRLLLLSTLYLKAPWRVPFDLASTEEHPFHLNRYQSIEVPMMHKTEMLLYCSQEHFQMVAIPFVTRPAAAPLALLVLLPNDVEGLAAVERELTAETFSAALRHMVPKQVELELPRFVTKTRVQVNRVLAELGMSLPFSDCADFSSIAGVSDLQLSTVIHAAVIDVAESGLEASAATAAAIGVRSCPSHHPEVVFQVTHPFFFALQDMDSGHLLFIGRVLNPKVVQ